jgi:hypothetical protein
MEFLHSGRLISFFHPNEEPPFRDKLFFRLMQTFQRKAVRFPIAELTVGAENHG